MNLSKYKKNYSDTFFYVFEDDNFKWGRLKFNQPNNCSTISAACFSCSTWWPLSITVTEQ